jgi:hypothetical protein
MTDTTRSGWMGALPVCPAYRGHPDGALVSYGYPYSAGTCTPHGRGRGPVPVAIVPDRIPSLVTVAIREHVKEQDDEYGDATEERDTA